MTGTQERPEARRVAERYARRPSGSVYSLLRPEVVLSTQEWQRHVLFLLARVCGYSDSDLRELTLVDVGCGYGGHLLEFVRMGFSPQHLSGIELLPERAKAARARLPAAIQLYGGDASVTALPPASQDIVFQSVVFSSILDDAAQHDLAERMWSWVRPGGGVLSYDFVVDNPANQDVRGVPVRRVRQLFPNGRLTKRRLTLAPPISRRVCRWFPGAYHVFNAFPFLRTHALCWIHKA